MGSASIILAAKRGANFRHLSRICRDGGLAGEVRLAGVPGVPALDRAARASCPLDTILLAHLGRRRVDRPWLFRRAWMRVAYLALVHAFTRWLYLSWVRRLRTARPNAVVLWNGHRMPESAVREAARWLGIRVIHIENGCLPNTRTVDAVGVNDCNSAPRDADFYRQLKTGADEDWQLVPRKWHRAKHAPRDDGEHLPERFVFVPFQVETDTQILLHSPWITGMRQLFDVLARVHARLLAADPAFADLCFVLKEHPTARYEYDDLHARARQEDGLLFRNRVSTQELIERCTALITINSTAGIEGLLFRKPVITLGNAFYNIDGLVLRARDEDELLQALRAAPAFQPDEAVRRGLITWLRDSYCVPKDPSRSGEDDWRAMAERIRALAATDA